MTHSIWMHAWDLESQRPDGVVAALQDLGLTGCRLAFSYHGGRMLLPRHPRRVYEQDASALYYPANAASFSGLRLQPRIAPEASLVPAFVEACHKAGLEVSAWTVLCHNDRLGAAAPDCCVENAFGDRYSYALCPANPDVRAYVVALCADIAAAPGIARLDLEALSFMGYEHHSLHDKRGVTLDEAVLWLLCVCCCPHCSSALGEASRDLRSGIRAAVDSYLRADIEPLTFDELASSIRNVLGAPVVEHLLATRRRVLASLLEEIRRAAPAAHLDLRLAPSLWFHGGKAQLAWEDLPGRADSATVALFGSWLRNMEEALRALPPPGRRPLPVHGGFVFHAPDCVRERDVRDRLSLLRVAGLDGAAFYCYGMAAGRHLGWLRRALTQE